MTKKVRQTITIDLNRLEDAFAWHLNLDDALQKISELDDIRKKTKDEILDLIKECRVQLTSLSNSSCNSSGSGWGTGSGVASSPVRASYIS